MNGKRPPRRGGTHTGWQAETIVPFPLPRTRGTGRLEALEALWAAIALDTLATLDELVANGEDSDGALEAIANYRDWFVGNVDDAIAFGRGWWEVAA